MVLNRRVRAFYGNNPLMVSSPFGGVYGINRHLLLRVLAALELDLAGRRVLDVGCGRGYLGDVVAECGGTYTGIDFLPSRRGFRFALADACALPFPDGAFDAVCCIDAFEHFPEPDRAAAEFRRVLASGGFLFLSAPNYANVAGLVKRFSEAVGWYEKNTWAPFHNWQPQVLETCLTGARIRGAFGRAGFTRFRRIGHGAEVGLGLLPWLAHKRMPEAVFYRLQRLFNKVGPSVVRLWPGASLHGFWRIEL